MLESLSQQKDFQERVAKYFSGQPNMIFASSGQGFGMSRTGITFHKDYADFATYRTRMQTEWGTFMTSYETFTISLRSDTIRRPLTLKHLADYIQSVNDL